jgi:site-specific DNA recombinase
MSSETLAREYLRVSFDASGRERSNDEQHGENVAAFADVRFGKPYRDTGSASRHAHKRRDDFEALLADLAADRFGAALLVLWESSRGSRKVGEWVQLIELCEQRQVRIGVTTHGPRTYDPTNPRDRRSLLEDAVDSEYESAKVSVRARRAAAANAAAGKPHGRIPYGYRRRYDPATGRLVGQEPEPAEAAVMVEVFDRLAAGDSLRGVARDLERRGIRSRTGKVLTSEVLRPMVLSPLYAGRRVHVPGGGRMDRLQRERLATLVDAEWPALVPTSTFLAVRHRLTDPARRTSRPGRGVHLLSMIAVCDVCGGPLSATFRRGPREYGCQNGGHVRVPADELDTEAEGEIVDYLASPDNAARLTARDGDDEALAAARDLVARVRAELDDLADQVGRGEVSAVLAARAEPQIVARLRDAERHVEELTTPPALRAFAGPADEVRARWKAATMPAKREAARLLLSAGLLGELRVTRSPTPGHRVPAADRIHWAVTAA